MKMMIFCVASGTGSWLGSFEKCFEEDSSCLSSFLRGFAIGLVFLVSGQNVRLILFTI